VGSKGLVITGKTAILANGHVTPLLKIPQNQKLILGLERPCKN
jgi:hypothetical protein